MANDNIFGVVKNLANSNSKWIEFGQGTLNSLITGIEKHIDDVETAIKNTDKSDYETISDLHRIYSVGLDVYESIVNLMTKINDAARVEIEIQKNMYGKEHKNYKDIFDALKQRAES